MDKIKRKEKKRKRENRVGTKSILFFQGVNEACGVRETQKRGCAKIIVRVNYGAKACALPL
jgi:hypothetical protein